MLLVIIGRWTRSSSSLVEVSSTLDDHFHRVPFQHDHRAKLLMAWSGSAQGIEADYFTNAIPPMVSNSPLFRSRLKRAHYHDFPNDLRPSHRLFMAHAGQHREILAPLTPAVSTNKWVTVRLRWLWSRSTCSSSRPSRWLSSEWVVAYATVFLFLGFPSWNGYAVGICHHPGWRSWLPPRCCSPHPWQLPARQVVPAVDAAVRGGQLGLQVWAFAPGAEAKPTR